METWESVRMFSCGKASPQNSLDIRVLLGSYRP